MFGAYASHRRDQKQTLKLSQFY